MEFEDDFEPGFEEGDVEQNSLVRGKSDDAAAGGVIFKDDGMACLGPVGIIRETFNLWGAHSKTLLQTVLLLGLPNGLLLWVFCQFYLLPRIPALNPTPSTDATAMMSPNLGEHFFGSHYLRHEFSLSKLLRTFSLWVVAFNLAKFAISSVNYAAVFHVVGCIYTGRSVSFTQVLKAVGRLWKRLMITAFCGYLIGSAVVVIFLGSSMLSYGLMRSFPKNVYVMLSVVLFLMAMTVVILVLVVYYSIVMSVAFVVASIDEVGAYGFAAVMKSAKITKGKRWTAFGLWCVYYIPAMFSVVLMVQPATGPNWLRGLLIAGLSLLVGAFYMTANSLSTGILYVSCKAHHEESIPYDTYFLDDYSRLRDGYRRVDSPKRKILNHHQDRKDAN